MKTIIYITFTLVLMTTFSKAQTSEVIDPKAKKEKEAKAKKEEASYLKSKRTVVYDFDDPKTPLVQKISAKQPLELILKNINPFIYEVTVNDSLITYSNQKPAIFDTLFQMPSLSAVTPSPPLTDTTGKNSVSHAAASQGKKQVIREEPAVRSFLSDFAGLAESVKKLLTYSTIPGELEKLLIDCSRSKAELKSIVDSYLESKFPEIDKGVFPMDIEPKINAELESVQNQLDEYIERGEKLKKSHSNALQKIDKKMTGDQYIAFENIVNEKIAIINSPLENAKKMKDKLQEFKEAKVGAQIVKSYGQVVSSRVNITKAKYARYNTDEMIYKVQIKKLKNVFCPNEISSFNVEAIVTGGVKVDFSTGGVVNIGRTKFFDQTYRKDPYYKKDGTLSSDSITIVRNRNNNVVIPSIGAFMNIYSRAMTNLNLGGIFGASVGTDQRLYWHLGGSVIIGKSDRWILSGGVSMAKADVLNGKYTEGQILPAKEFPAEISIEKATRLGGFFSLTWNLNLIP